MADRRYAINSFTVNLDHPTIGEGTDGGSATRNVPLLLELFEKHDVRSTFFVSEEVTRSSPASIRLIAAAGHELAVLAPPFVSPLDQLLHFREEIADARSRLMDLSGLEVVGFRSTPISSGWRSPAMIETLTQEGFIYSSSTYARKSLTPLLLSHRKRAHRLATPSGEIWELPLTSWRPFGLGVPTIRTAGGARFGILPAWVIARGVEGMNRHGEPAILYVHPWGLDPAGYDTSTLPLRERLLAYGPREETLEKIETIFSIYRFGSLLEAFASRLTRDITRSQHPRRTSIIRRDPT